MNVREISIILRAWKYLRITCHAPIFVKQSQHICLLLGRCVKKLSSMVYPKDSYNNSKMKECWIYKEEIGFE